MTIHLITKSLFLLAILLPLVPRPVKAETQSWSQPIELSTGQQWAWFPSITADIYGDVHVVWNAGETPVSTAGSPVAVPTPKRLTDEAGWLMYTWWNGQRWSQPREIEAVIPSGDALRSAITSDRNGHLYLFYKGMNLADPNDGSMAALRFAFTDVWNAERATSWSPGKVLSRRTPTYFPAIAVDSRGVLHALWTEYDGIESFTVYYSHSVDGGVTWSLPTILEGMRPAYLYRL